MVRPALIILYTVEGKYYPFKVNVDKYSGSCNSLDNLSTKIFVQIKTNDVNVKVFNVITNKNEAKPMLKCYFMCL